MGLTYSMMMAAACQDIEGEIKPSPRLQQASDIEQHEVLRRALVHCSQAGGP
jgi:hypothetical protein